MMTTRLTDADETAVDLALAQLRRTDIPKRARVEAAETIIRARQAVLEAERAAYVAAALAEFEAAR